MTVATETESVGTVLERVEELEDIAGTLPEQDERRARLDKMVHQMLADAPPVRLSTAAVLLDLNEKTVRAWLKEGVLTPHSEASQLRLDPERLHAVRHLVRELREAGKTRGLLDAVYRRLADQALLSRADLQESLEQMRRGDTQVLVPKSADG